MFHFLLVIETTKTLKRSAAVSMLTPRASDRPNTHFTTQSRMPGEPTVQSPAVSPVVSTSQSSACHHSAGGGTASATSSGMGAAASAAAASAAGAAAAAGASGGAIASRKSWGCRKTASTVLPANMRPWIASRACAEECDHGWHRLDDAGVHETTCMCQGSR